MLSDDGEWRVLEWVEGPAADRPSVFGEVRARHPELAGLGDDWLRVDVLCGRDGTSRMLFWVRTSPPPVRVRKKPRHLP